MKTIVVLLVVAVSSCSAIGALGVDVAGVGIPPLPDVLNNCLINDLKESSLLLIRLAALICTYDTGVGKLNDQQWEDLLTSTSNVLRETTCLAADILGIDVLKTAGKTTAEIVKYLVTLLRPVVEMSGLPEVVFEATCKLTEKFFKPTCLPLLIGGDLPKLIIDLKLQACPNKDASIFMEDLKRVLQRLSCLFGEGPLVDVQLDDIANALTTIDPGTLTSSKPETLVLRLVMEVMCTLVDIVLQGVIP
ncbi:ranaspumin-like [Eleutherodactylus coqui]|uniref:ranaspumin-like n=1 Tax=Eleutherodactylus coqui TaxID=57060 RepID=UPI0034633E71